MSPSQGIRLTTLPEGHTLLRAATAAIGADYCDFCAEWRTHYRAHWLTRFDLLWTAPERSNAVEVCVLLDDEGHPVAGMHVEHGSEGLRDDPVWFANVWTRPFNRGGGCAATLVSAVVNGLPAKGTRIGLCADPASRALQPLHAGRVPRCVARHACDGLRRLIHIADCGRGGDIVTLGRRFCGCQALGPALEVAGFPEASLARAGPGRPLRVPAARDRKRGACGDGRW